MSQGTGIGDYQIPKKVQYVDIALPDTIMKAIRIIERLLAQTKYHKKHVLYKNYPSVNLKKDFGNSEEEEKKDDGMGFMGLKMN